MSLLPRGLLVAAVLLAGVEVSACEPFNGSSMLTKDPDGTLVIRPFVCSPENHVYDVSLEDADSGSVIWAATAVEPDGVLAARIRVGDAAPAFHETVPLAGRPLEGPERYVRIGLTEFFNGKRRNLKDGSDFVDIQAGRYYGDGYYGVSAGKFDDLQDDVCDMYYGHPDWLKLLTLCIAFAALAGFIAWRVVKDHRRLRKAKAA